MKSPVVLSTKLRVQAVMLAMSVKHIDIHAQDLANTKLGGVSLSGNILSRVLKG